MKNSSRFSIVSLLLLAALPVTPARAQHGQEGPPNPPPPPPLNQSFPGPLGLADFGKIISGEFTGDLKRDAVVMNGSSAELLFAPECYDTAITVDGGPFNDIATLSGLLPYQDYVLTVGYTGLVRHRRDSASSTWDSFTLRDDSSNWASARRIAVGYLDDNNVPDLVGIAANGHDVLIEYGNLDGTYTPGTTFTAYGTPLLTDVWLLNWREEGVPGADEIALNSMAGIQVWRPGSYIEGVSWTYSPILGTVIDDSASPTSVQRLALVTKVSGNDIFQIYGDTDTEPYFSLGHAGVVSMAAADADGDQDTEVFLSVNSENTFWRMDNQSPAATSFTASPITEYPFGPPNRNPALNHAGIALADFDGDGCLDAVAPAQGDPGPQPVVWSSVAFVHVGCTNASVDAWRPYINHVIFIEDTREIEFHVVRPTTILQVPAGAPPGSLTRISVKVFLTPDLGIGTLPDLHWETVIDLPPVNATGWFRMPTNPPLPNYSLGTSEELFDLVLRQTVYTPTGAVLKIAPAMTGIFTADPNTDTISTAPETQIWIPPINGNTDPVEGGLDIGPTVPSMDPDEEPKDEDPRP